MSNENKNYSSGIGFTDCFPNWLLFLVFLTLKLTGVIGWSWWWITAPLWGPLGLVLAVVLTLLIGTVGIGGVIAAYSKLKRKKK